MIGIACWSKVEFWCGFEVCWGIGEMGLADGDENENKIVGSSLDSVW